LANPSRIYGPFGPHVGQAEAHTPGISDFQLMQSTVYGQIQMASASDGASATCCSPAKVESWQQPSTGPEQPDRLPFPDPKSIKNQSLPIYQVIGEDVPKRKMCVDVCRC